MIANEGGKIGGKEGG